MIKDKYELKGFSAPKMPKLKGHVKIKTYHAMSGNLAQIEEGDNVVTDAVADIFANNYLGGIDYSKMMPLWQKWFGGVLCFEQAHANLTASDYYLKPDSTQHLVAHAGQTAVDPNHDDDGSRGNPSSLATILTDNSIKMVFEWGSTHGNGTIRALSLTHSDTGSYGTGSLAYDFVNNFEPFAIINQATSFWNNLNVQYADEKSVQVMYDDSHALAYYMTDSDEITVYVRKLAYMKAGIHQTLDTSESLQRTFTITMPFNLYAQPYYYFDYANKYLWIFTNLTGASTYDNDDIKYCKIDCENEELVNLGTTQSPVYYETIHSDYAYIAPLGMGLTEYANILKVGNYFLFPTSTSPQWSGSVDMPAAKITGYQKINMSNISDQETISFNDTQTYLQSLMGAGDVIVNNGRVINGLTGYTCKQQFAPSGAIYHNMFFSTPDKVSTYAQWLKKDAGYTTYISPARYILANKMLLTTKFNLDNAVTKDTTKSMLIEYTLTEVSENE